MCVLLVWFILFAVNAKLETLVAVGVHAVVPVRETEIGTLRAV